MAPSGKTPPFGVIQLFSELKTDLRSAVEADQKDHESLRLEVKEVRALNEKQSRSLERIEGALGVKKRAETETGKTRRTWIKIAGTILTIFATAVTGYLLGK